ncbi:MAG: hypothetical protein CM1200mP20_11730 [Pseudomonadota bacterium]|nr:MAG: hypothetical protein CM1200mP20_11730 [Pseudomonadota bacterium]
MIQTGHDALALLQQSRMLYDELIKKYQLKCDWETKGALYVCKQHRRSRRSAQRTNCYGRNSEYRQKNWLTNN